MWDGFRKACGSGGMQIDRRISQSWTLILLRIGYKWVALALVAKFGINILQGRNVINNEIIWGLVCLEFRRYTVNKPLQGAFGG